jgi:hypothetical protein
VGNEKGNAPDLVEVALADAIGKATAAGEWGVVGQLGRELEARRNVRSGVVDLQARRRDRRRDEQG